MFSKKLSALQQELLDIDLPTLRAIFHEIAGEINRTGEPTPPPEVALVRGIYPVIRSLRDITFWRAHTLTGDISVSELAVVGGYTAASTLGVYRHRVGTPRLEDIDLQKLNVATVIFERQTTTDPDSDQYAQAMKRACTRYPFMPVLAGLTAGEYQRGTKEMADAFIVGNGALEALGVLVTYAEMPE